jgi:ABC-type Fe3+/spermidine/putrescine transport system ATPase subunit
MTEVRLENLGKIFEKSREPAVKDLNLSIKQGELVALLGPSGCGKTTTLKMIAGLHSVTSGRILFNGKDMAGVKPEKRGVVMVYQNYLLFPYMNVEDNVAFGLRMRHVDRKVIKERVGEYMRLVQLQGLEKRKPSELSGGQQQRVALIRALIIEPSILLLDEPLSNLDTHLRDEMRELILRIQRELKLTTIFVTHDQEEAVLLADKIALMMDGVIQQYSSPRDFYDKPATCRSAAFFGNKNTLEGEKKGSEFECPHGTFTFTASNAKNGRSYLLIRPENISLAKGPGQNTMKAVIDRQIYMGTYNRYITYIDDRKWEIFGDPEVSVNLEGKEVDLYFPPEKIWMLEE